jgi:hypothetical protein
MQQVAQVFPASDNKGSTTIKTTLYELMAAISEEVQPGEERLITEIVLHLQSTGRIKFNGTLKRFKFDVY